MSLLFIYLFFFGWGVGWGVSMPQVFLQMFGKYENFNYKALTFPIAFPKNLTKKKNKHKQHSKQKKNKTLSFDIMRKRQSKQHSQYKSFCDR